jgi:2-succinyl-5-enolpyruvyl-6-hydroxy-3-cyclohexene-1-carboxylate synthase
MFQPNRNFLWTRVLVDELARAGLKVVVIAPGSRSTPLAIAFHEHPNIKSYIHLDERSAAFFALGMAMNWDEPIAIVCTSGTAAANFFPAIVEAHQTQTPLLVLTTDRPPELRYSGANQTIDQTKIYGDYALWSVDAPLPEGNPSAMLIRSLRSLACRAYATANGIPKGVVHINLPFRPPLEPTLVESDHTEVDTPKVDQSPFVQISRGVVAPTDAQVAMLSDIMNDYEHGIIVCGPRSPMNNFPEAIAAVSRASGYPIFADVLSGLRFGTHTANTAVIGGYDNLPVEWEQPDVVVQFGAVPTSKTLNTYLDSLTPQHRILIKGNGIWADDTFRLTDFIQADPELLCGQMMNHLHYRGYSGWAESIWEADALVKHRLAESDADFDGMIFREIAEALPGGSIIFAGNSLPVRHADEFLSPGSKRLQVLANRGASGIDGVTSTALGVAATSGKPLVLVIGDISFYHDMNGLLAIQRFGLKVTVVLLNNDGGGIFHRLPIAKFEPPFTDLFLTPHGLDFAPVAQLYGLEFASVEDRPSFRQAFTASLYDSRSHLIEYKSDARQDAARRNELKRLIKSSKEIAHA